MERTHAVPVPAQSNATLRPSARSQDDEGSSPSSSPSTSPAPALLDEPESSLAPTLPADHEALLALKLRRFLPALCRTAPDSLELPNVRVLPSPGDLKRDGLPVVKLSLSFSDWKYLRSTYWSEIKQPEEVRELTRKIIVELLDRLMDFGHKQQRRFVFASLDFAYTEASMRAIFNGMCAGKEVHRETEVEVLNLSHTNTSPQALMSLHRLRALRELYIDYCPALLQSGKQVFSVLVKHDKIPRLRLLSVVGTSSELSHLWLEKIESSCPALREVYFTRKKGTKALGWVDLILMQTMRRPQLLPCGHIGDKESALRLGYCGLDRTMFLPDELVPLHPNISFLQKKVDDKGASQWMVLIVDQLREPLADRTLYHMDCGTFFNASSLTKLFALELAHDHDLVSAAQALKTKKCPECKCAMSNVRVCYPNSAQPVDEQNFPALSQVAAYSIEGLAKKSDL